VPRSDLLRLAGALLVTAALLAALSPFIDLERLKTILTGASGPWLALTVACYVAQQLVRAARTRTLLGGGVPLLRLTSIHLVQSPINASLPMGAAEAVLVLLLRKLRVSAVHPAAAAVFVARALDLALFVVLLATIVAVGRELVPPAVNGFLVTMLLLAGFGGGLFIGIVRWRLRHPELGTATTAIMRHVDAFIAALRGIDSATARRALAFTVVIWLLLYLTFLCTVRALGLGLSPLELLWIFVIPTELLPVKGVANIGTFEAAWFVVLTFLGYDGEVAMAIAIGCHLVTIAMQFIGAGIGALVLSARARGASP